MSNQNRNSDFFIGMTDDPYSTIGQEPTELLTDEDWSNYYFLAAERYQASLNLEDNKEVMISDYKYCQR